MLSNVDIIPKMPSLLSANAQLKWKRYLLGKAGKTSRMVAGPFLNKIMKKLLKLVQNWKFYFAHAPFFYGPLCSIKHKQF